MSDDGFFGNMPYLATMPSCAFYIRGMNGSSIRDWSKNHVTLTNNLVTNSTGVTPKFPPASNYYNGSGYLEVPYSSSGNSNNVLAANNFTYSMWFNANSVYSSTIQWLILLGNYTSLCASIGLGIQASTLVLYMGSTSSTWDIASGVNLGAISTATWYNVIITRSGSTFTGYLNGSSTAIGTSSNSLYNAGYAVLFGQGWPPSSGTNPYTGYMDEIALFNGANGEVPAYTDIWKNGTQLRRLIVG
jgi:hypothetical protein